MEVGVGEAEMDPHQLDFHIGCARIRSAYDLRGVRRVDEDLGVSARLQVGHAVGIQGEVAGAGDVALKMGNAVGRGDSGDVGEVDLVRSVPEISDDVGGSGRGVARVLEGEGHVARTASQLVGAGAADDRVVAAV